MNSLKSEEKEIYTNSIIPVETNGKEFEILMEIYKIAMEQVEKELNQLKESFYNIYGYDIINNITTRIKTPKSIINKMKKKNYLLNYQNLIENINDIAGVRITCSLKSNIDIIIKVIEQMPNMKILKVKDYIKKPKKSGYSGYHIIVETPVKIEKEQIPIKVEIQIRTMAMDFWATNEHKMKYKTNKKLSVMDSKKLKIYAKILNMLDEKVMKIYQKQNTKKSVIN